MLAAIAGRRHGVVTRRELLDAGFTPRVIQRRIGTGGLIPVHRGIYIVGHTATAPLAYECAAILACRPRALLSHATAGRVWRIPVPDETAIHVTVVGRHRRSLPGVRVHHLKELPSAELRRRRGLPLTSPSLTLLDLGGVLGETALEAALHEARVLRRVTDSELSATLAAHPNRRGAHALGRLLASEGRVRITRSEAERRALRLMRAHGLKPDATDHSIGPYVVDFWFRAERVAVEYDSRAFHDNARRFVSDRRRIAYLAARDILTFPLTARDLGPGADRAMADLRATLAARRPAGSGG